MIVNSKIGKGTKIYHRNLVNIYGAKIGKNCMVGTFCEIQKGVVIGDNCRIQSHTFIPTGVRIGNNVFIGHGVMFINDLYPRANCEWELKETTVEDWVSIGSNATILPVYLRRHCLIGAGAVVTKNVDSFSIVVGNPAKVTTLKTVLKSKLSVSPCRFLPKPHFLYVKTKA